MFLWPWETVKAIGETDLGKWAMGQELGDLCSSLSSDINYLVDLGQIFLVLISIIYKVGSFFWMLLETSILESYH
jgi:hypothetical protein